MLEVPKKSIKEAREFQPDAIMLETQEPPFPLHIVWFTIIALLILLVAWACFAEVDKIVTAPGKIVTSRPPITMKPLELTTIKSVHVKKGKRVRKGEILFSFDQTKNQAELIRLMEQLVSYQAMSERLDAEAGQYQKPFMLPAKPNQDQLMQYKLYISRKNYFDHKLQTYDATIIKYKRTIAALEETSKKYEERKAALARVERMMSDLEKQHASSLKDLLETQVQVLATAIQVDQQAVEIVEQRQALVSAEQERAAFVRDWERQIMEELVSTERTISSYRQEIEKCKMLVSFTELRAPCDAVVHELAPFQEGSAVREAEALITLIPLDVKILAEVDIPAKDISRVRLGDECRLKFDALPFQQCGTLNGEVTYISQDAFSKDPNQVSPEDAVGDAGGRLSRQARGVTYQAQLEISGSFIGSGAKATVMPGMTIMAEIKVGKRKVISYIFNPFLKALNESIREP